MTGMVSDRTDDDDDAVKGEPVVVVATGHSVTQSVNSRKGESEP